MRRHNDHDAREWDQRYTGDGDGAPMWSGWPNGTLVAEVTDLVPGTALDVGCGEGADAIWLAQQGWQVTAADPSRVALDRAEAAAREAGVEVTWIHAGLLGMPGGTGVHDLVSAQYTVLRRTDDDAAITALLRAVAPGGTLLFVHHELDPAHATEHGFDPADYVMPGDVAARLDNRWEVEVHETRPRPEPVPPGARHVRDVILRVRRPTRDNDLRRAPNRRGPRPRPAPACENSPVLTGSEGGTECVLHDAQVIGCDQSPALLTSEPRRVSRHNGTASPHESSGSG